MLKCPMWIRVAVLAIVGSLALLAGKVSTASASVMTTAAPAVAFHTLETCPIPGFTGYTCTIEPATVTTTSHTHIVVKKTVTQQLHQYEQVNHVIVTINMGAPLSGPGCIDPTTVKKWNFHVGDSFKNADRYNKSFYDTWEPGWEVCNWHLVKIKGQWYVKGTKANCKNTPIYIPVNHRLPHQKKLVIIFRSVKSFQSTYDRWATHTSSTTYSCMAPFSLTYLNGKAICFLATQIPVVVPPTTTPTPTPPTVNCPAGTVKNSAGNCVVVSVSCPTGTIKDSNGNCVTQTNTAALNCQQAATAYPGATVSFNNDTLTCTIIQVNANCSNVIIIVGNGSPQTHQEGNCNSTPPPPPPAPVTLSLSNLTQPQNGPGGVMPDGEGPIGVCVTVQGKSGDTIKLGFGATYGSFTNSIVTLTSSGTDRACANYTAPNDAGDVGKTETWTVTGTDTTANVNASPATVNFTFQPLPGGDTSGNR